MKVKVNNTTCSYCGACVETCPRGIFLLNGKITIDPDRVKLCLGCGQCMAVCRTDSIVVEGYSYEQDFLKLNKFELSEQSYFDFLASRRSIRTFKKKEVEKEKIEKILRLINLAPYGVAHENIQINIVQDQELIQRSLPQITEFYDWLGKKIEHPITKRFIRKSAGIEKFNTIKNHLLHHIKAKVYHVNDRENRITHHAPVIIIFHARIDSENYTEDGHICMTYAFLAAHALGLGATAISLIPPAINKRPHLKQMFQIPDNHIAISSVIIGYPKFKFQKGIMRKPHIVKWI